MIRIVYTGDDWAWPVYSIAIAEGCLEAETFSPACTSRLTARMVRSPAPEDMQRPRERGLNLVKQLVDRRATSRSAIRASLGTLGAEWMEADLRACPGIGDVLERAAELDWVPRDIRNPGPEEEIEIVIHADSVKVDFVRYNRRSTYDGYIANGSPAEWAVELEKVLEPCWKPAQIMAPWMR